MNSFDSKFKKASFAILKAVIIYALAWTVIFTVSFLINKFAPDATTAQIHQYVLYAGYPLVGIGWAIGWVIAGIVIVITQIVLGIFNLIKYTAPYSLYVIGTGVVSWLLYAVFKALVTPREVSRAEQEADARHDENMRFVRGAMMLRSLSDMSKK